MRRLRLVASLALVSAGVTALVAIQLPAPPSSAVAAVPPTQPGSAFATSTVLGVNPEYGGLSLVVRGGQSTASYTGTQSVADSQAVNLGYIGGLLAPTSNPCLPSTGGPSTSIIAPLDALQAASSSGPSKATADEGVESVTANPSPESASATTNLTPVTVPGLLAVTAQAESHVTYASGQDQLAEANTTMSVSLLGGVVTLNGLSWNANQESGTTNVSNATFSMTSVTVAGVTTKVGSPTQLATAITAANKVLSIVGVSLAQPAASTDAVTGTVTIGPLQVQLVGTALTNLVLGKLNPTQSALEQELGKVLGVSSNACIKSLVGDVGAGELVAGIVEGIMAGGGVIDLNLGGASADTEVAPSFANPLDAAGSSSGGADLGSLPSSLGSNFGLSTGLGLGLGGGSSSPLATSPAGAKPAAGTPAQSAAEPAALVHCVSASPTGRPGCWSGAATVGAAVLLGAGVALFAADFVRSRRKLVRPKETL